MPKEVELQIGEIRGNRKFLGYAGYSQNINRRRRLVLVKCLSCGEKKTILKECFLQGRKCFNCSEKEIGKKIADFKRSHGLGQTRFYRLYYTMKGRCLGYGKLGKKYYHDKGIKCLWNTFDEFREDMYLSYLDHVSKFGEKDTTIERIDNNKDYCKENCRRATIKEQKRNTTRNRFYNYNGVKMCEQDIRNLTKEKRSQVRRNYERI